MIKWQPTANLDNIRQRAAVYQKIRDFFTARDVLEVETPLLSPYGVTDIHTASIRAGDGFLQTSPEYAMKRLLATYPCSIFQICKAFRQDERGSKHRPEFTMLEWYRVGFDHHQLMDEMDDLLQTILGCEKAERLSYAEVFRQYLSIDPLHCSLYDCLNLLDHAVSLDDKDAALSLLMGEKIEPQLGQSRPIFIFDYPHTQAALAKISDKNPLVAERFEVYFKGIELANGFHELTDAREQKNRFLQEQRYREENNLPLVKIDPQFIAALEHGLPNCAGVALGLDRLLMLLTHADSIDQVIAF